LKFINRFIIEIINKKEGAWGNLGSLKPDEKLKTLLELNDSDELTYFTIQKYMNKHFVKNAEA
jgi:chromatin remodeling complex protein RSC6